MTRLKPNVDIVLDILEAVIEAQPLSSFAKSIHHQYLERGGLSKKQLEGLYNKAQKVKSIPPQKMATLEAIILRKHSKHRSALPENEPLYKKDEKSARLIDAILEKHPKHKMVLVFKTKLERNEPLSSSEKIDLERFYKVLKS